AAVVVRGEGPRGKHLVAYYTCTDSEATVNEVRRHMEEHLPAHMVPGVYVRLERMPLSPNGKLDRKALPAPEGDAYSRGAYEAPVGEIERTVGRIWEELLGAERVGRQDNFFELGGHSLLAVTLIERLRRQGLRTDVRSLFEKPTLWRLAESVQYIDSGDDI